MALVLPAAAILGVSWILVPPNMYLNGRQSWLFLTILGMVTAGGVCTWIVSDW